MITAEDASDDAVDLLPSTVNLKSAQRATGHSPQTKGLAVHDTILILELPPLDDLVPGRLGND